MMRIVLILALIHGMSAATAQAKPKQDPREEAGQDPKSDSKAEASQRFQKGVELYGSGDVRAALIEFKRAYKLMPTYRLLYNMAQASAELKDYVEAHGYYSQYLLDGGGKLDEERVSEVKEQIAQLEGLLASIELRVSVDGAEISIDGVPVGVSPASGPVTVSAGRRKLVVTREGYSPWERSVDLAGRDAETIEVKLISLAAAIVPEPVPVARTREDSGMGAAFWTSAVVTAVLAAGTGYAAYETRQAQDEYDLQLRTVPNSRLNINNAGEDLRNRALITDIGLGLTALGLVSTVFFATRDRSGPGDSQALHMQLGPAHVALTGTF